MLRSTLATARTSGIRLNLVSWSWPCWWSFSQRCAWPTKFIGRIPTLGPALQPLPVHRAILLNIFQISRKVTATNVLGTCTDFIWFQNSHLKIAPRGHPAEDEVQITLIVVITVIVAIAGQELFIFCVIMKPFAVCGSILANCT